MQELKFMKKLIEHDRRLNIHDKRFNHHDKRFKEIEKRSNKTEALLDLLARKSLEHNKTLEELKEQGNRFSKLFLKIDLRFESFEKKIDDNHSAVLTGLDRIMKIVERLDQERLSTNKSIKRLEKLAGI